jgi:hypothetical protein
MRTVITQLFNEEYMLPWWIEHHKPLFDHGIFIDYGSTDATADICRSLAPDWRLVRSRNLKLAALAVDFEVMQYEAGLPGWKIALNVTEFLICGSIARLEAEAVDAERLGSWIPAAIMVDPFPEEIPAQEKPLFGQKHHGFLEKEIDFSRHYSWRARLYHRADFGAYTVGRHGSQLPGLTSTEYPALILWYGFSPWRPEFLRRKLQIANTIPEAEVKAGWAFQHLAKAEVLENRRAEMLPYARDLSSLVSVPERPIETRGVNIAPTGKAHQSSVHYGSEPTAGRAIDGAKDGRWSFHTNYEERPWWSIDLGKRRSFDEIIVYNRLDIVCKPRAGWLQVLVSDDGEKWTVLYAHDGTPFGGIDGYPLRIKAPRTRTRYVKLELSRPGFLHLDEVEIYEYTPLAE